MTSRFFGEILYKKYLYATGPAADSTTNICTPLYLAGLYKRICTPLLGRPKAGQRCRALRNCLTPPLRIYDIPNKRTVRLFDRLQILHKKMYSSWPAGHSTKKDCTPLILPLSPKNLDVSFLWNPKKRDVKILWRDPGALLRSPVGGRA